MAHISLSIFKNGPTQTRAYFKLMYIIVQLEGLENLVNMNHSSATR